MGRHLLRAATERRDLESGVDEVERGRLELACEGSSLTSVTLARPSASTNRLAASSIAPSMSAPDLSVGPTSLSSRSHDRTTADVEDTRSATFPDLVEQAATSAPHPRLELKPFQLGGLISQEVRLRGHPGARFRDQTYGRPGRRQSR